MALRLGSEGEIEEFHSIHSPEFGEHEAEQPALEAPTHPVRSMQGAFEESILESTDDNDVSRSFDEANGEVRRQTLLDAKKYDDSWTARWKQRPGAKHHPLLKLMAQIVFGMHLLQQRQAKSEEEVVKILQTHVNEVDTFLERTSEDFDLAINDIEERIRFLKLPMVHQDVFEIMLDDKKFRTQLLDGNDKIEKIIERTFKAMNASLLDIQKGIEANKELGKYLNSVQDRWPRGRRAISDVFAAMLGNEQGWTKYSKDLQAKGSNLRQDLVKLGTLLAEMSKLAAAASRRNKTQSKSVQPGLSKTINASPGLRSKFSDAPSPATSSKSSPPRTSNLNKPLPKEPPAAVAGASQGTARPHPVPFAERYERPRESPLYPERTASKRPHESPLYLERTVSRPSARPDKEQDAPRPRTAGARMTPREARAADARGNTADLAEFLKLNNPDLGPRNNPHHNPLRSNPPETTLNGNAKFSPEKKSGRSQSQGAGIFLNAKPPVNEANAGMTRSRSQGAMDILKAAGKIARSQPTRKTPEEVTINSSSEKQPPLHSTGFARRLSKRMKHLPIPEDASIVLDQGLAEKPEPPPDSAYSSGPDETINGFEPRKEQTTRPESTVGPLPVRIDAPPDRFPASNDQNSREDGAMSVKSLASTHKSRALSVTGFFPRKWRSRKLLAP